MKTEKAKLAVQEKCEHGEGPVWDPFGEAILWVDLTGCLYHSYSPGNGERQTREFAEPVCVLAPDSASELTIAFAKRIARVSRGGEVLETLAEVEPDLPGNRCNDGKRDPAGRLWVGTMSNDGSAEGAGSLYRLDDDRSLRRVLDGLTIANGLGWSPDGRTMYFIDSPTREVWAFDFDPADSSIGNRSTVVAIPEDLGIPDGMTVDSGGQLWVAIWGGGCVCQCDPSSGEILRKIETACPHTTSCAFGQGEWSRRLFITTSRLGLDEEALRRAPQSGSLFRFDV